LILMANTSNHGWEIPDVGGDKDVWGQILNDFFDGELDKQVKLEGTFANRPAAGQDTVKYYHATDQRIVYYNDGSSWEAVYGLGTDSNPVPGTSHFEAVSTERASIAGNNLSKVEKYQQDIDDGSVVRVNFDNLPADAGSPENYLLDFSIQSNESSPSDLRLYLNGVDGAGNASYYYVDQSGTKNIDTDSIVLGQFNTRRFGIAGHVQVSTPPFGYTAVSSELSVGFGERVDDLAQYGGISESGPTGLSSIQLDIPGLRENDEITLYEWL